MVRTVELGTSAKFGGRFRPTRTCVSALEVTFSYEIRKSIVVGATDGLVDVAQQLPACPETATSSMTKKAPLPEDVGNALSGQVDAEGSDSGRTVDVDGAGETAAAVAGPVLVACDPEGAEVVACGRRQANTAITIAAIARTVAVSTPVLAQWGLFAFHQPIGTSGV